MTNDRITDEDHHEAVRRILVGIACGSDAIELTSAVADLHRKNDTFPGEVYLRLAAEVVSSTLTAGAGPIPYAGLRERHLGEVGLRGKENRKFQYAVLCSAAMAGGLEPDLLEEVIWWGTDDFWKYGAYAAVSIIRASADRRGVSVDQIVTEIAEGHGILLTGNLA